MGLLNYTTKIDADKTAQEIARELSSHGAKAILTEYDEVENTIIAISFIISLEGNEMKFKLPCDWHPVYEVLTKDKKNPYSWNEEKKLRWESEGRAQAVRTAWRIVKDWVEAQMALVETRMVSTTQVFLPYAVMKDGQTLFEKVAQNPQFLLGDGNEPPSKDIR